MLNGLGKNCSARNAKRTLISSFPIFSGSHCLTASSFAFPFGWSSFGVRRATFGVRWSIVSPYYSLWGNIAYFNPAAYNPANAVPISPVTGDLVGTPPLQGVYNGMVIPGTGWPSAAAGRVGAENTGLYNFLFSGGSKRREQQVYRLALQRHCAAPWRGICLQQQDSLTRRVRPLLRPCRRQRWQLPLRNGSLAGSGVGIQRKRG